MIWFACKNCGKKHSRPEGSIGTMVFCDCGQGLTVPWESTVEPPPVVEAAPAPPRPAAVPAPAPAAVPLPLPRLTPVPVGEERVPPKPRPPEPPRPPDRPLGRPRRPGPRRRDPRFCLNHEDTAAVKKCAACGDAFCAECLLEFNGETLCGPCKNFRVRALQQPPRLSGKAVASVLIGMLAWPLGFCLVPVALSADAPALVLLALLPHLTALGLGLGALRDAETDPRVSGRGLAVTGVLTGAVASVLTLFLAIFPPALPY
jgi:hypothetical protein